MANNLTTTRVEHGLTPDLLNTIKKGAKYYIVYLIVVAILGLIGLILFYVLFFKPILQKGDQMGEQFQQERKQMNEDTKNLFQEFNKSSQESQQRFESQTKKLKEDFNKTTTVNP